MTRFTTIVAVLLSLIVPAMPPAHAQQEPPSSSWSEVKCARYRADWTEALARRGRTGLSLDFIERHEAFLASGCTARADVCPRSAEELDLANILVLRAMNAGTASTFLPFSCRR